MLFIYPMWDHESQRIGKQKCTPLGYRLHGIAELLGFIGLFLLIIVCAYLGYRRHVGTFHAFQLLLMAIPVGMGLIGEVLYHYATREASWMEDGQLRVYKWKPNQDMDVPR